ncbi:hypothetical protein ABW19_dt0203577 [Dactylella cylindrospora]|nr:hypothetical protein ABW19_dt0203577 [Dactylella cylindrospora]
MPKPELVVGIDFGTTYSGFSWAKKAGLQDIKLVQDWEIGDGFLNPTNDKVRTWISYKGQSPSGYGYTAAAKPCKWFKLLLQPDAYAENFQYITEANASLKQLGKSVDDVITDYLRWIWGRGSKHIEQYGGSDFRTVFNIKVILTVPAAWKPIAKDRTLQAAKRAGIPGTIDIVSEPEAAALSTLMDKKENDELRVGDAVIVCDAGGGTVDLISYQVEQLNPLRLKECAVGEGGLCGSVFLDLGFEQLIKSKVGVSKYNSIRERYRNEMMAQFEYRIKRHFDGSTNRDYTVTLQGAGDADDDDDDEDNDLILVKGTALRTVFDTVCTKIDTLVANQVKQIRAKGIPIKTILLIGGFGESSYLHSRLDGIYKGQGIKVLKTQGAWSAVCRGATAWGLNNDAIVSRVARYSYGQPVSVPFDSTIHDYKDRYFDDAEDIWRANNQMDWLIRKTDDLKVNGVITSSVYGTVRESVLESRGTLSFSRNLWYCDYDRPPRRKEDDVVVPLCTVEFDIETSRILKNSQAKTSPADGAVYRYFVFAIVLELGSTQLTYSIRFAGETVGMARAKYKEDFGDD